MSAITNVFDNSGTAWPTDPNPNTTAPPAARQFDTLSPQTPSDAATLYIVPTDGTTISLHLWLFDTTINSWFAVGSALSCPPNQQTTIGNIPRGLVGFLQVTLNLGVTKFAVGFLGD
jgi:hypothetical protein